MQGIGGIGQAPVRDVRFHSIWVATTGHIRIWAQAFRIVRSFCVVCLHIDIYLEV